MMSETTPVQKLPTSEQGSILKLTPPSSHSASSAASQHSGIEPRSDENGVSINQHTAAEAFLAAQHQQLRLELQQRNVYISGLPANLRPSAFRAMCDVFGRIESSKLCMEGDNSNVCRGYGFVLFLSTESANACINSLNGKIMADKQLQVRRADLSAAPQPPQNPADRERVEEAKKRQQPQPCALPMPRVGSHIPTHSTVPQQYVPTVAPTSARPPMVMTGAPFGTTTILTTGAPPMFAPVPYPATAIHPLQQQQQPSSLAGSMGPVDGAGTLYQTYPGTTTTTTIPSPSAGDVVCPQYILRSEPGTPHYNPALPVFTAPAAAPWPAGAASVSSTYQPNMYLMSGSYPQPMSYVYPDPNACSVPTYYYIQSGAQ